MAENNLYIQFEKPMTWEECNSEEGQARLRNATNIHRKLHEAEDQKQEQARAQRAENAARIRAAFQKTVSRGRGNEYER